MYKSITVWNYGQDRIANAYRFNKMGFNAISWLGMHFASNTEQQDEELVKLLKDTGMKFTVHSLLPDPDKPEACEAFLKEIEKVQKWQRKYGLLYSYTFDFWTDVPRTLPYLGKMLEALRGSGVWVACEDKPLTEADYELFKPYIKPEDKFGILIDVGHMNIRQHKNGLARSEDYIQAFENLPLPLVEVHLSDNDNEKDEHSYLGNGTLPLEAAVKGLKSIGFDGFASVEMIPRDWSREQTFANAERSSKAFFDCWNK